MTALESLRALQVFGQSVWLDYIRRSLITWGELRRLIDETAARRDLQPGDLREGRRRQLRLPGRARGPRPPSAGGQGLYETLAIRDIQDAADALRPVYEETARRTET